MRRDRAHHRRRVRAVEHPRADPDDEEPERALPVGRVRLEGRHQREPGSSDEHPERGQGARPAPIGPDPRERRRDEHPDRHGRELDAGRDRIVALRPLEEEDEEEEQREARQPVDERGRGGRREQPAAEDGEVEHRGARSALDRDEGRQQHGRGDQPADDDPVVPAGDAAAGEAEHQPGETDDEGRRSDQVESADAVRLGQLAEDQTTPHHPGERQRHVEPEHPVPRDRDQDPAEHGPEHEPDSGDHRVRAHRESQLFARERVGDERGRVGEQQGAANALEDPPQDELGPADREPGAQRSHGEQREPDQVGTLAPEQVRQPAGGEHQHRGGDHVREDHPHQLEQRGVKRALEVGQGDDQTAGVDRRQQHPHAGGGERPPLVVRMLRVHPRSPARQRRAAEGGNDGVQRSHPYVNVR